MSEKINLKESIEDESSLVEACEEIDLTKMAEEGDSVLANHIQRFLSDACFILDTCDVE